MAEVAGAVSEATLLLTGALVGEDFVVSFEGLWASGSDFGVAEVECVLDAFVGLVVEVSSIVADADGEALEAAIAMAFAAVSPREKS